jgi:hypothetical protein
MKVRLRSSYADEQKRERCHEDTKKNWGEKKQISPLLFFVLSCLRGSSFDREQIRVCAHLAEAA